MMPFVVAENKIIIPIILEGERYYSIIDSGANRTYVSNKIAENKEKINSHLSSSLLKHMQYNSYLINSLIILGHELKDVSVSNNSALAWVDENCPIDINMAIGNDLIFSKILVLDFIEMKIGYIEKSDFNYQTLLSSSFKKNFPFVKLTWENKEISVLLDFGAGISIINKKHEKELLHDKKPEFSLSIYDTTSHSIKTDIYRSKSLKINKIDQFETNYIIHDLSKIERELEVSIDIILGINFLLNTNSIWIFNKEDNYISILRSTIMEASIQTNN